MAGIINNALDTGTTPLSPLAGGTGVNNGTSTITLAGGGLGQVLTSDGSGNGTWVSPGYLTGAVLLSPSAAQTILSYPLNIPGGIYTPQIVDVNGNIEIVFNAPASAVNYLIVQNQISGIAPGMRSNSTVDTNVGFSLSTQGTGIIEIVSLNPMPLVMRSGTSYQHFTYFSFPDTLNNVVVTFQDVSGTVAYVGSSAEILDGDSGTATPSAGVVTFTGASTGLTFAGSGSTMTLGGVLAPASGGALPWTPVTTTPITAVINTGYMVLSSAGSAVITLPSSPPVGSIVRICGHSTLAWQLLIPAGQTLGINGAYGSVSVTAGNGTDSIELLCVDVLGRWETLSYVTNLGFTLV